MAEQAEKVIFKTGTKAQYDSLVTKNDQTLYWLTDSKEFYKGSLLFGTGATATTTSPGLLSSNDKIKLDELVNSGITSLQASNEAIVISGNAKEKLVGIKLSGKAGNHLTIQTTPGEEGLYVNVPSADPYTIVKDLVPQEGYSATYHLQRNSINQGEPINIPKDFVVKSGVIKTIKEYQTNISYSKNDLIIYNNNSYRVEEDITAEDNTQFSDVNTINVTSEVIASVGNKFIDFIIGPRDQNSEFIHMYVNVSELMVSYDSGSGINISPDRVISVKLNPDKLNGLNLTTNGLGLELATNELAGAMSPIQVTQLNTATADIQSLNSKVGNVEDEPSQTGSLFSRVKQNASNITLLNLSVGALNIRIITINNKLDVIEDDIEMLDNRTT